MTVHPEAQRITLRSIGPDEASWFAALDTPRILDPLTDAWNDGSSCPDWTMVAEADGRPIARAALLAEPMGGGVTTLEGVMAFPWADLDHPRHGAAFRTLVDALAERSRRTPPPRLTDASTRRSTPTSTECDPC